MPIDPNIILQGSSPPKPLNALEMYGQMANIQNAQNQNKLFQANTAAGAALQQAKGDPGAFNKLIEGNPDIAPAAMEAYRSSADLDSAQQQALQQHAAAIQAENAVIGGAAAPLLQTPEGKLTYDAVAKAAAGAISHGDYPKPWQSEFMANTVKHLGALKKAVDANPEQEDALTRQFVQGVVAQSDYAAKAVERLKGTPTTANTGGQTKIYSVSPITGAKTDYGHFDNTLSPEAQAAARPTVQYDAQGRPIPGSVPTSAVVTPTGQPKAGNGFLASGAPPGVVEAGQATGLGSGQMLNDYRAEAANAPRELQAISAASDALSKVGTGRGTAQRNAIVGYLSALPDGVLKALPGMTDQRLAELRAGNADFDTAVKYMTQIAGNAAAQYGAGTNEKLLVAAHGNASVDINHVAAEDMLKVQAALVRSKQVALRTWEQQGRPDSDFSKWLSTEWAPNVDVRAFMVDKMTPQQRKTMIDGMSKPERTVFFHTVQAAHDAQLPGISDLLSRAR